MYLFLCPAHTSQTLQNSNICAVNEEGENQGTLDIEMKPNSLYGLTSDGIVTKPNEVYGVSVPNQLVTYEYVNSYSIQAKRIYTVINVEFMRL